MRLPLEASKAKTGSFLIDGSADLNTTAVLQSPRDGLITVTLESPSKQQLTFNNQGVNDTNWFLADSDVGVSWKNLTEAETVRTNTSLFCSITQSKLLFRWPGNGATALRMTRRLAARARVASTYFFKFRHRGMLKMPRTCRK